MPTVQLHGGLPLDPIKERSTAQPIRIAPAPSIAVLPLDQHAGEPATALVQPGARVLLGQPIAHPSGEHSAWLHAPVSGQVIAIEPRPTATHLGAPSLSIVIENDGKDARYVTQQIDNFATLTPQVLREHIARGGIVGLGGAVFPTDAKLRQCESDLHLLLNGVECEPYISCDHLLMRERADDVIYGARVIMHATGANRCTIVLEDDTPRAATALQAAMAAQQCQFDIVTLASLYPAGGERQLIAAVCGHEVPHDGLPPDIGLLCQNVATAAAIARWLRDGEPLISRIVTITGAAAADPGNWEARIGTPLSDLLERSAVDSQLVQRLIMGGSMMGRALPNAAVPVIKAMNCIIAAAHTDLLPRGAEMPCIRCGACAEVCPPRLLPQQLHWYLHPAHPDALERFGLLDCIECGCCDYVCPSQIPLVERFREAKHLLRAQLAARRLAEDSRERFQERTARLERWEAERRARLEEKRREWTAKNT